MRRETRKNEDMETKIIKVASIGVAILALIVIGLLIYGSNLNKEVKEGSLSSEQLANLVNKTSENLENTEHTSTEMGKSVEEAKEEIKQETENKQNTTNTNNTNSGNSANTNSNTDKNSTSKNNTNTNTNKSNATNNNIAKSTNENTQKSNNSSSNETTTDDSKKSSNIVELSFIKPVEGEIIKEFAKDNLLFSQTLQEWTVHTGIDIKADKTTIVKSAEAGTVKSIKNDPRYGLTIVVAHDNGFETVYSNLLTSEFVVEGEKVEKGQSLGTVGNTAAFEIADDSHLHFEILKDSIQVDPSIYIK